MSAKEKWQATLIIWGVVCLLSLLGMLPGLGLLTILGGVLALWWAWWFITNKSDDYPPEDCCGK